MIHPLLGKWIQVGGRTLKVGFLRADCDAGVSDPHYDQKSNTDGKALLIRLSDQSLIRELRKGEDYDAAILSAKV